MPHFPLFLILTSVSSISLSLHSSLHTFSSGLSSTSLIFSSSASKLLLLPWEITCCYLHWVHNIGFIFFSSRISPLFLFRSSLSCFKLPNSFSRFLIFFLFLLNIVSIVIEKTVSSNYTIWSSSDLCFLFIFPFFFLVLIYVVLSLFCACMYFIFVLHTVFEKLWKLMWGLFFQSFFFFFQAPGSISTLGTSKSNFRDWDFLCHLDYLELTWNPFESWFIFLLVFVSSMS